MPATAQAEAKKDDAIPAAAHPLEQVREHLQRNSRRRAGQRRLPLQQHPQRPEGFKVPLRLDLNEQIRRGTRFRRLDVDHHDGAVLPAARQEFADGIDRISLEMARMGNRWVRSPEDDQVGPVASFAERAGRFALLLHRHHRWSMAQRGRRIDRRPEHVRQPHRGSLPLGAAPRQPIDQRRLGAIQNRRRPAGSPRSVEQPCPRPQRRSAGRSPAADTKAPPANTLPPPERFAQPGA